MALKRRKVQLAAKAESAAGTAEALTATEAIFFGYDLTFNDDVPVINRPGLTGYTQNQAATGARMASVSFEVDLAGKGTSSATPYWASTLLPACGWANSSGTFTSSVVEAPVTIAFYADGLVRKIAGAMGNWSVNLKNGEPGRVRFDFTGKLAADTDVALLAPTYETVVPPRWASSTSTLGSYALKVATCSMTAGNTVKVLEDVSDATGYKFATITDRVPTGSADPEAEVIGTKDWMSLVTLGTTGALSIVVGATALNVMTFTSAACQVTAAGLGDRDGILTRQLNLLFTGANPLQLVFT